MDKDSNGQRKLEYSDGELLPSVERTQPRIEQNNIFRLFLSGFCIIDIKLDVSKSTLQQFQ